MNEVKAEFAHLPPPPAVAEVEPELTYAQQIENDIEERRRRAHIDRTWAGIASGVSVAAGIVAIKLGIPEDHNDTSVFLPWALTTGTTTMTAIFAALDCIAERSQVNALTSALTAYRLNNPESVEVVPEAASFSPPTMPPTPPTI